MGCYGRRFWVVIGKAGGDDAGALRFKELKRERALGRKCDGRKLRPNDGANSFCGPRGNWLWDNEAVEAGLDAGSPFPQGMRVSDIVALERGG